MKITDRNCIMEWSYASGKSYSDPFNDIELDLIITAPDGQEARVPAFWAGEQTWRVRYASSKIGRHHFRSVCSDEANTALHGLEGVAEVRPYEGDNPLFQHGPVRVAKGGRYLEHNDGTPFFWLGDTWWMGFCKRLGFPGDFQTLCADRVAKGFTVIQIVAGLYPDMPAFDERGANEAGFPWEKDYARINPAYFDRADRRVAHLADAGLMACIVGCWGYFLPRMGVAKMKQHWRYLVARYGAYPVVWCLAGEGTMPYYLSQDKDADARSQKQGWTELASYVRRIDPFGHPITIHPTDCSRHQVNDPSLLDIEMLQTGHGDRTSIPNTVNSVVAAHACAPAKPVINAEVCYEGIGEACRQEVQRFMFWACVLSGACGHTYGANGIWQVNTRERAYGPSPHGMSWGNTPWEVAYQLPGSEQVGLAKRLLERYPWWRFEPHPEWVEPHWSKENYYAPYAGGIPDEVRIIFLPSFTSALTVEALGGAVRWRAFLFDPTNGGELGLGVFTPDQAGRWSLPSRLPIYQDWVMAMEKVQD